MNKMVNEVKAAEVLNISVQTARNWRCLRKGPPYIKLGRSVRYRIEDLEDFINSRRIDPEKSV